MKNKNLGFTVVELLMAMVSAGMLALVAGSLLVFSYNGWFSNHEAVEMQRDATLAMETIGRQIRGAVRGEVSITGSPSSRTLYVDSNTITNFTRQGSRLIFNPGGFPIVRDNVIAFECLVRSVDEAVDVLLVLKDPASGEIVMRATYRPRNQ